MSSRDTTHFAEWLAKEFRLRLAQVLQSMLGQPPSAEAASPEDDASVWWEQPFSLPGDSRIWIGWADPVGLRLGAQILSVAGIGEAEDTEKRDTFLELIRQTLGGLAQSITALAGGEVTCLEGRLAQPPPDEPALRIRLGEGNPLVVEMVASPGLKSALLGQAVAQAAAGPAPPPGSPAPPAPPIPNIKVLYDIELPVSVSFGRAQLPLRQVLKLTSGAIVELNRGVNEPVELVVNNCVIARGEVVVVEGNYGVRILQVVSQQERLRTLL